MLRKHIVIAGTGRTGTTLLVQLLTELGLDTGFSKDDFTTKIDPVSFGGLEHSTRRMGSVDFPRVVKSPFFHYYADSILKNPEVQIEHILIPIRRLEDAAKSRIRVEEINLTQKSGINDGNFAGGLTGTKSKEEQEVILGRELTSLIMSVAKFRAPHTFLNFPDFALDADYLYESIKFLLPNVEYDFFCKTHLRIVDLDKIHTFK